MAKIGFIGIGIMGHGMARCLLKAGRELVVWNRDATKAQSLCEDLEGDIKCTVASSAMEVVEQCDVTYCMLSTPEAVKAVYEAAQGILAGISEGKVIVDCATLTVEDMAGVATEVASRGGKFLEAPVSGSKGPAAQGQLIFLTGGSQEVYDKVKPDLDVMGKASFYLGEVGQGTRMKLVVNMTMGSMMASLGEGLALTQSVGLDQSQLLEVMDLGAMSNPMFRMKGPKMIASDHAPNFPLQHAQKDMRFALAMGDQAAQQLPVAAAANAQYISARGAGLGDSDFSAVVEAQRKK